MLTFSLTGSLWCVLCLRYSLQQKVSELTNRNMPARNTLVQVLVLYTSRKSQNALCHRQIDTDDMIMPIADHVV